MQSLETKDIQTVCIFDFGIGARKVDTVCYIPFMRELYLSNIENTHVIKFSSLEQFLGASLFRGLESPVTTQAVWVYATPLVE